MAPKPRTWKGWEGYLALPDERGAAALLGEQPLE